MSTDNEIIQIESYDLANADDGAKLATVLADYIKKNNLSTKVQGKDFVNVEGWQYAGSRLGIVPRVVWTKDLSTDAVIRFECRVELYDLNRREVIGSGEAECDSTESGKKFYARYAIKSMAQTRAVGKAFRNMLAWIIKAAGYNPTPAEEMPTLQDACFEALTAPDMNALSEVAKRYQYDFGKNQTFKLAGNARKVQLEAEQQHLEDTMLPDDPAYNH